MERKTTLSKLFLLLLISIFCFTTIAVTTSQSYSKSTQREEYGVFTYGISHSGNVSIRGYSGNRSNVTIPSTGPNGKVVDEIYGNVFEDNTSIVTVNMPPTITAVIGAVFKGCTNLKTVNFSNKIHTIAQSVFRGCTSLENITLPTGLEYFYLGSFSGCSSLTEINIPQNVKSFSGRAEGLTKLNSIKVDPNNKYFSVKNGLLLSRDGKTLINCLQLKSNIVIPEGVTTIKESAFYCTRLEKEMIKSVTLPSTLKTIEEAAFRHCEGLESISIPDNVTSIGEKAFLNCFKLKSVKFSSKLKTIGKQAFYGCMKLQKVSGIPASVTSIGDSAFSNCESLSSISVSKNNKKYRSYGGILYTKSGKTLIICPRKIKTVKMLSSTRVIKDYAFERCTLIKKVSIPKGVKEIGFYTFQDCKSLETVVIPVGLTKICDEAFTRCKALKRILIKNTSYMDIDYSWLGYGKNLRPDVPKNLVVYCYKNTSAQKMCKTYKIKNKLPSAYYAPKKPVIKVKTNSKTSVKISWKKVSNASGYLVYRSTSSKGKYKRIAKVKKTSYINKKLKTKKKYYYKVRSYRIIDGVISYSGYSKVKRGIPAKKK